MSSDLFEQLARQQVPQVPPDFAHQLHRRLNSQLMLAHSVDFAIRVVPGASLHFLRAIGGLLALTVTGNWPEPPDEPRPPQRET